MQNDDRFMCRFYYIDYMPSRKTLLDYRNLFSPSDYQKNDNISTLKINRTKDLMWKKRKKH